MYAIIDIETTGGKYDEEGITEIAIYQFDGHQQTDQFSSLINPEKEIQPFVVQLTGINNKMLRAAPKFYEVAKRIVEITENCVIVAHNAEFDYRILQTEFRRLGFAYERKSICTVKLAQQLIPDQPSYSLGKLLRNLGIPIAHEHRAHGDANATLKLFQILMEKDTQKQIIKESVQLLKPHKAAKQFLTITDALPSETGVYYIHGTNDTIIYIGKSKNIKKRILSHLTSKQSKAIKIQKQIQHVTYALTGSELIALLKEQNEIKQNQPPLNHARKFRIFPMGIRVDQSDDFHTLVLEQVKSGVEYISVFKNQKAGRICLQNWCSEHRICLQKTSLKTSDGPCFNQGIDGCDGACVGTENSEQHNEKIKSLMDSHAFPHADFLIITKGREKGEKGFLYIQENSFQGYGYYELNHQIKWTKEILSRLIPMSHNNDTKKIIHGFLRRKNYLKLIHLERIDKSLGHNNPNTQPMQ